MTVISRQGFISSFVPDSPEISETRKQNLPVVGHDLGQLIDTRKSSVDSNMTSRASRPYKANLRGR